MSNCSADHKERAPPPASGEIAPPARAPPHGKHPDRTTYVGRAAPPVEENWDSYEEEEQQAMAAAGVTGEEEPAE